MKILTKKIDQSKFWFFLILTTIFVLGVWARTHNLEQNPPGLDHQEALLGNEALTVLIQEPLFIKNTWSNLYLSSLASSIKLMGNEIWALRSVSAFFGILTLIGFFLLLKELRFSKLSLLLGTFLLSASFWQINFSRLIDSTILIPCFLAWFFYFFFLAIRKSSYWLFGLTGLILSLSFYFNLKLILILPILIFLIFFYLLYYPDFWKNYWKKLLLFLAIFLIFISPLIFKFYQKPVQIPKINQETLIDGVLFHLNSFYFQGDPNQKHNHGGTPLIPATWTVLFSIGFALSLKEILFAIFHRKEKSFNDRLFKISLLTQGIFWVMLIPGFFTSENIPDSSKIIGTFLAIIFFILIPFEYILRLKENLQQSENFSLKPWRWKVLNFSLLGLVSLIILTGISGIYTYHFVWNKEIKTLETFDKKIVDLGKTIKNQSLNENNFLILPDKAKDNKIILTNLNFTAYPEIEKFQIKNSSEYLKELENLQTENCSKNSYLFFENNPWLIEQIKTVCPNLKQQRVKANNAYYEFWLLKN
jgi:4-amino-4-deoxy-L-arabinose transferase-like glycosyltransferase